MNISGSKYQSNLNEIDRSEHKSNVDRKGGTFGFDYTSVKGGSVSGNQWIISL